MSDENDELRIGWKTCGRCYGRTHIPKDTGDKLFVGNYEGNEMICPECNGAGEVPPT